MFHVLTYYGNETHSGVRKLTLRDVSIACKHIRDRIIEDKKFEAALHGKPIKFPNLKKVETRKELTDQQKKAFEIARKQFFKGKKR